MRALTRSTVLAAAFVLAVGLAASGPAAADGMPSADDETEVDGSATTVPPVEGATAAPDAEAAAPTDEAALQPGAKADEPLVLDGPLRPKGSLPDLAAPTERSEEWRRSFQGGVRWTKGDTSVTVSGTPATGFRIGGTISR